MLDKRLLCPYCFRHFTLSEIHWRCSNARCKRPGSGANEAPGEPDPLFKEYLLEFTSGQNADRRLQHAFKPPAPTGAAARLLSRFKSGAPAECDWCNRPTPRRICPHCHNDLPYAMDTVESHIIAVVGAKEVGKTHYIAVLIEQLKQQVGASLDISLLPLNDATTERYQKQFYTTLYQKKQKLDANQAQTTDTVPLMYRLKFRDDKNPLSRNRSLTLVFFDTAGENFDQEEAMTGTTRYLVHASAIIMLVDPLQMGQVRDDLVRKGCPLPQEHTEPVEILDRLVRLFYTYGGVRDETPIRVPLAVTFTKADLMRDYGLLPPGNAAYTQPRHQGAFRVNTFRQIHDEIQASLIHWTGTDLDGKLKQYFATYGFCCASALGEAPAADGSLSTIAPFRVEDPFLWALSKLGYIRTC